MIRQTLLIVLALFVLGTAARADAVADGKALFEQQCTACHTIGAGDRIGPDLRGVTERRSEDWLQRFISAPDKMLEAKDPIVVELYEKHNRIPMPNLGLSEAQVQGLIAYLRTAGGAGGATPAPAPAAQPLPPPVLGPVQTTALTLFLIIAVVVATVFAWVMSSSREPTEVDVKRAYGVRRVFFLVATAIVVVLLASTLPLHPYPRANEQADRVVYVAARQYEFMFSDEPIVSVADIGRVPTLAQLKLKAGSTVEFRVTALDVNHGFGLYGPQRDVVAQTQAMPGFVNRLFVRLAEPGQYKVLCLEYCAAGHHVMQAGLSVE